MPNQKLDAITLNLCPDCGVPPRFYIYSDDGSAECDCFYVGCESYNVKHAESWQEALAQWNENTAKAYAERPESPISDKGEHEPADVENGAQNGSECDTREKLEADVYRAADEMEEFTHGEKFINTNKILRWLDRQEAITERECIDQRIADQIGAMWKSQKIKELQAEVDELTAELDSLRSRLKTQADSFQKLERDNAKLRDTLARVRKLVGDAQ